MSSSTISTRGTPNHIGWLLAMQPGLWLGGGIHLFSTWIILGEQGEPLMLTALFTALVIPSLLSLFARTGNASHWIAFLVIMTLTLSTAALATLIPTVYFGDIITGMESPYLAGLLQGSPGFLVSPFVFWVLHRLSGRSSPWAIDED